MNNYGDQSQFGDEISDISNTESVRHTENQRARPSTGETSSGGRKFQNGTEIVASAALIPDPFNEAEFVDLAAAAPMNFNLVDGTVAFASDPQLPFILLKGSNRDTWFYAPRWGRIAKNPDGEPAFLVTKKVRNNPDGSQTTIGGVLSFMIELVVDLPSDPERDQWAELIKKLYNLQPQAGKFNFQPLRLAPGKMDIFGLDSYVKPGQQLKGIDVGASSSIGFAFELNAEGADHFAAMVGAHPNPFPPQVAIMCTYKYQYMIPQCQIQASGFKKKCYDYFSASVKARASYFGLVNGSAEYQSVRADLRQSQALNVSVVGTPPPNVDLQKMLDAIFDTFVKMEVGQWINPDPKPVDASAPGGFFGGVSVSMKSVDLSDTAQFDQVLNFTGVGENIHQVSFNFEQAVGSFDSAKHLFIEQDDIKLPFKLAIGNSDKIKLVAPSATYTTLTGPRNVTCQAVNGGAGGLTEGIIQFTWPQRPTSAQISVIVDFVEPFGPGYIFTQTQPISDTGAAFNFQPDTFIQRTHVIFVMALETADTASKALFKWNWAPPEAPGVPRKPVSGFSLITPDMNGETNNLPTYDVQFPYHPDDWRGEATPRIEYKVQGLTGEWKNRTASGSFAIGETSLALNWEGARALGDTLTIPSVLTQTAIPDPAFLDRARSQA